MNALVKSLFIATIFILLLSDVSADKDVYIRGLAITKAPVKAPVQTITAASKAPAVSVVISKAPTKAVTLVPNHH